jgi:hypothetical protein
VLGVLLLCDDEHDSGEHDDEHDGPMTDHGQARACGRRVRPVTTRFLSGAA